MGLFSASGATVSMTAVTTDPVTFDAAGYALLTFTEVGQIEDGGAFGDESSEVTFDSLGSGRTTKVKGQRNSGTFDLVTGLDDEDSGQALLYTAEADDSTGNYHFKVTFPNKLSSGGTDAIRYFSGKVLSTRENLGTANNVVSLTATISIDTPVVRVAAT